MHITAGVWVNDAGETNGDSHLKSLLVHHQVIVRRSLAADRSPENLRKLAGRIAERYELELVNHFEIEEQALFPAVRGSLERPGILDGLIAEHRRMAAMVRDLETPPTFAARRVNCSATSSSGRRGKPSTRWASRSNAAWCEFAFDISAARAMIWFNSPEETFLKAVKSSDGGKVILETDMPGVERHAKGKVRDVYSVDGRLLIVATDRISAFDYILATGIPDKGKVLTQLSIFWFDFLRGVVPTHFITADVAQYPRALQPYRDQLEGRSMLVKRAKMIEIECVARGYLSGSGWKEYAQQGAICGIRLPAGLKESDKLPEPIFTPAIKAQTGHDENISFERVVSQIGGDLAARLRDLTLDIYLRAAAYAETRGILIADTKFEFGFVGQELVLGDEVLTPDSSRFWPLDSYRPGGPQMSYDKQFVRDYLESIRWNKQPPAPPLPPEVAARTSEKYRQAYQALTGRALA